MLWLIAICITLSVLILILIIKLLLLYKSMGEVETELQNGLEHDTNTLLTISSRDRHMRRFVDTLNQKLKVYRLQRKKYQNGNVELENAVTNISHDLRTPLTAIRGYLDLLEKEPQSEEVKRYLAVIENRTKALETLTEELFRYSVITSSKEELVYEEICLNAALEEGIAEYYPALKKSGITPEIAITNQIVLRTLDKNALMRIIGNILSNAIKYSEGDLDIRLLENGTIIFANTAPKLNKAETAKLFDRFYTVETARNSTGLGLSIAKSLVEKMHGTIGADYVNGKLEIQVEFDCQNGVYME